MKSKVQAQRKFAQGAAVPPTINNANVTTDRRVDVSPNKEKSVVHSKTSAKSLLDIVSFKSLHKHAQPYVLLERLDDRHTQGLKDQTSSATVANKPSTSNTTSNKSNNEPKQQQTSSCSTRAASARTNKNIKQPHIITPRLPMHLRSRIIIYSDPNKTPANKNKNLVKDRKKDVVNTRKQVANKRQKASSRTAAEDYSNDDDQPLTYFRQKTRNRKNKKGNGKAKKGKRKRPKSVKNFEPAHKAKEKIVRRILEVPDIITEIPESVIDYDEEMDLTDSEIRPESSFTCQESAFRHPSFMGAASVPRPLSGYIIRPNPFPRTSFSNIYDNPVPGTSSAYQEPVPSTSRSSIYLNPTPGTSSSYYYQNPAPQASTSNFYLNPVPGTSSSYENPVPSTSRASLLLDPIMDTSSFSFEDGRQETDESYFDTNPGTGNFLKEPSISICSSVEDDLEQETGNDFEEVNTEMGVDGTNQEKRRFPVFAGPFNEIETILLKQPPFYGIRDIDNWVSADMTHIPSLDLSEDSDQKLHLKINFDVCIGPKVSTLASILDYGPSFYDCLCFICPYCKNIHEILNEHKSRTLQTLREEANARRINEENVASANDEPGALNIVISNVRSEEMVLESIIIDDDDDKDKKITIDLTEDSNDVNFSKNLVEQNVGQPEIPVQNVVQPKIPVQKFSQPRITVQNFSQTEIPIQNFFQPKIPVQNFSQPRIPVQNFFQPEIPVQNFSEPRIPVQNFSQTEIPVQNFSQPEIPKQNFSQSEIPVPIFSQRDIPVQNFSQPEEPETTISEFNEVPEFLIPRATTGRNPSRRRVRVRTRTFTGPMTRQRTLAAARARTKNNRLDAFNFPYRNLPKVLQRAVLVNAPVFYPTLKEFKDPMAYMEKVMPSGSKFGLFKIVPPEGFQPTCKMGENSKFTVANQYIARLFSRWGPAAREMCTIRAYLASQKVFFARAPLLDGLEVNLPRLFHIVQRLGGLKAVLLKKKWTRVAEELKMRTVPNPEKKFDLLCLKYLLPYDTLTKRERQAIMMRVEQEWCKKSNKLLARVVNPLHPQKRLLGDSDPSDDDEDDENVYVQALNESEDCVVRGRNMCLGTFKKIADTALRMHFPPGDPPPTTAEVEELYWKIVLLGTDHVSINSGFIDTGSEGFGFPKDKNAPYGRHPWNLKVLAKNKKNVLRSLGLVEGVTVPSLHVGMVYSTSCWHRDPHGLPWIEYMHQGPDKIWYGVPESQSANFRTAAEILCPTSCQRKPIWLSSDIAMIPPNLLLDQNVRLSRIVQKPGEYIVVMPRAYSCSIATGFTISESVYFATNSFLQKVYPVFQELRESCEPSLFSLEHLLISMAKDPRTPRYLLQQVHGYLSTLVGQELVYRNALEEIRVTVQLVKRRVESWNLRDEDECQVCRTALYLSRVLGVFGKKSKLCQQHAVRVLNDRADRCELDLTGIVLEVSMTSNDLDQLIFNLQRRLLV